MAPQIFNQGVSELLGFIVSEFPHEKYSHVAHFNIAGGIRDMLVPSEIANFDRLVETAPPELKGNFLNLCSLSMRNVYESLDHNSQYYSHRYLNQLIPIITEVSTNPLKEAAAYERVEYARKLLNFNLDVVSGTEVEMRFQNEAIELTLGETIILEDIQLE